jgi:DNA polymerase phi
MDDEQMMALDSQLAAIFSERRDALAGHKPRSQKKKDAQLAKENIVQLKMRVVDLLDVYVRNEPSNPLIMTAIMPLLSLLRFTKSKQLGEKAHSLLKGRLCRIRVLPQLHDNVAVMDLVGILADVHKEAQRSTNKAHSLAANQCSVFISKVLLRHDKNTAKDISQIFASTLSTWIEKPSSKVTPALFFDFVNFASAFRQKKD